MIPETARQWLDTARTRFSQQQIAGILGRTERTVRRWESGDVDPPDMIIPALEKALASCRGQKGGADFRFIDLFAGIGGIDEQHRVRIDHLGGYT